MGEKEWVKIDWFECIHCGEVGECLTDKELFCNEGLLTDGESVRCVGCGCKGQVSVYDDIDGNDIAGVLWDED